MRYSNKISEALLGVEEKSGIYVLSDPTDATVFLDGKEVGKTPFDRDNLEVRDYTVKIEKGDSRWQGKVKLTGGTVAIINRDLSVDQSLSAGEILTLDRGSGITVVSSPQGADVEIDGVNYGKSPVAINISSGEHTVVVSSPKFLKRSTKVELPQGLKLTVYVELALSEVDLTTIATPVTKETVEVLVKPTPTGFLRVRETPSLNGKEVAQVKPGTKLILLEEAGDWDRVRLPDEKEGYVSSAYVEKINP